MSFHKISLFARKNVKIFYYSRVMSNFLSRRGSWQNQVLHIIICNFSLDVESYCVIMWKLGVIIIGNSKAFSLDKRACWHLARRCPRLCLDVGWNHLYHLYHQKLNKCERTDLCSARLRLWDDTCPDWSPDLGVMWAKPRSRYLREFRCELSHWRTCAQLWVKQILDLVDEIRRTPPKEGEGGVGN